VRWIGRKRKATPATLADFRQAVDEYSFRNSSYTNGKSFSAARGSPCSICDKMRVTSDMAQGYAATSRFSSVAFRRPRDTLWPLRNPVTRQRAMEVSSRPAAIASRFRAGGCVPIRL